MVSQNSDIKIKIAEDDNELNELYRFRYEIYVNELLRKQLYVDHEKKCIQEPLDKFGINVIAQKGDKVIGSARVNLSNIEKFNDYVELYSIKEFDQQLRHSAIVTKFMVSSEYRTSILSLLLAFECFKIGSKNCVRYTFIDCYPHLIKYFKKLGFKEYKENIHHPEYGEVTPMVLHNQDLDYLKMVNSPFFRLQEKQIITQK